MKKTKLSKPLGSVQNVKKAEDAPMKRLQKAMKGVAKPKNK